MLDSGLADKTVVVTGRVFNIGRAVVHAFAAQKACVVLVDAVVENSSSVDHILAVDSTP